MEGVDDSFVMFNQFNPHLPFNSDDPPTDISQYRTAHGVKVQKASGITGASKFTVWNVADPNEKYYYACQSGTSALSCHVMSSHSCIFNTGTENHSTLLFTIICLLSLLVSDAPFALKVDNLCTP